MKSIVGLLEWLQTETVQTSVNHYARDVHRPTFHWEGEDLMLDKKDLAVAKQMAVKIQTTFAVKMGWLVKKKDGTWALGPNLVYDLHVEWDLKSSNGRTTKVKGLHQATTSLSQSPATSPMILVNDDWLKLALTVSWRFQNLRQAFADAVFTRSRMLMVYSDVVRNNLVGDTKHPLLREVVYKRDGTGSMYFEPLFDTLLPPLSPGSKRGRISRQYDPDGGAGGHGNDEGGTRCQVSGRDLERSR